MSLKERIRSDNGTEFRGKVMGEWYNRKMATIREFIGKKNLL